MDLNLFKHAEGAKSVAAGEVLFREGDSASEMYVILNGEVALSVRGKVVDVLGPASIFGEMALVDEGPRSATAVTRTECVLLAIDSERFVQLVQLAPSFALDVMKVLVDRLRRMDARL